MYVCTLAPGLTFWDAGEFIAAVHGFGIPHPPGTPLFVALGRVWTMVFGPLLSVARASNLLSAVCTAAAGGLTAWLVAREENLASPSRWGAIAGALCAGLATSVWANATETEVYAAALLMVVVTLAAASNAARGDLRRDQWILCTTYLIAITPAVHLSALIAAPAAISLAARRTDGSWCRSTGLLLSGATLCAAGVGRMSWVLETYGTALIVTSALVQRPFQRRALQRAAAALLLTGVAATAILILMVRANQHPALNQGNPSTLSALADVVARRQYDLAPLWPRRAPVWIQVAGVAQYADWQFGMGWGRGIFTTPVRVVTTLVFVVLGIHGYRTLRNHSRRFAVTLAVLTVCGTLGVCAYLNLKAGASIGYGLVPAEAHEARERDYFFVLGFWSWGMFVGYGACAVVQSFRWPGWTTLLVAAIPLVANWRVNDRSRRPDADVPAIVARQLLSSVPKNGVLFLPGDNDTYPIWYLQQVERFRLDVTPVTVPLLPADWYAEELARKTGLIWPTGFPVPGARYLHEERAALIARAARMAQRPITVSTQLPARQRALLGSRWFATGSVYASGGPANGTNEPPEFSPEQPALAFAFNQLRPSRSRLPDDVGLIMLESLDCARIGRLKPGPSAERDSLEVRCNVR